MAGIEDYRLADPEYVDFKPSTAGHAILRFRRMQKKGLAPWKYPEAMVECAASLSPGELAKFEGWINLPVRGAGKGRDGRERPRDRARRGAARHDT